jgi:hypothetical protein
MIQDCLASFKPIITITNDKTAQDTSHFYVGQHQQPRVYYLGQKVLLCVAYDSNALKQASVLNQPHAFVHQSQFSSILAHQLIG